MYTIKNPYYSDMHSNNILDICRNNYDFFLKKSNVVGLGLGYKTKCNIELDTPCIIVYVTKKFPLNMLHCSDVIPTLYKGILTDVVESGVIEEASLTDRVRPVPGGYSIGVGENVTGGSLGCLVRDRFNIDYILSCNHVLNKNKFDVGTPIIQPSYSFGGRVPNDIVGNLARFVRPLPITPEAAPINLVDCAIAEAINTSIISPLIAFLGTPRGVNFPLFKEQVQKVGFRSELTFGTIKSIGTTITIQTSSGNKILYVNQIITSKMVVKGDSGSVLLNLNKEVIGLIIATSSKITVCNNIFDVLKALQVGIVTL